jgi:hypothetical protein
MMMMIIIVIINGSISLEVLYPENERSKILRKVKKHSPNDAAPYCRIL